jgi:hypothetical protein
MYDLFNKKLEEFANELVEIYPNVIDFKVFRSGLYASGMIDKKLPQDYFSTYVVVPFEDKIMARDEEFFLQKQEYENGDLDIISRLKGVWGAMNEHNKDAMWKYLQVLVYLCKQCKSCAGI